MRRVQRDGAVRRRGSPCHRQCWAGVVGGPPSRQIRSSRAPSLLSRPFPPNSPAGVVEVVGGGGADRAPSPPHDTAAVAWGRGGKGEKSQTPRRVAATAMHAAPCNRPAARAGADVPPHHPGGGGGGWRMWGDDRRSDCGGLHRWRGCRKARSLCLAAARVVPMRTGSGIEAPWGGAAPTAVMNTDATPVASGRTMPWIASSGD